jgi:fatty acid desaturase
VPTRVSNRKFYPIIAWRAYWGIGTCYFPIAAAVYLVLGISWWFYPLAAFVIANRLLKLSLLAHEGLHGNLSANRFWNDWIGRWLCAYPSMISFTKYRRLHQMHHWAVGSEKWDPDRNLYDVYPVSPGKYLSGTLGILFSFRMALRFAQYYVLPEGARLKRPGLLFSGENDLKGFLAFHLIAISVAIYLGYFLKFELLYVFPVTFVLQPYVILMGGLQHGPVQPGRKPELVSRSIRGSEWLMEILLPCNIHFHAEHHLDFTVPHYWLRKFSKDLNSQGVPVWKESYVESMRTLFGPQGSAERSSH